jgi:hypothetical protein
LPGSLSRSPVRKHAHSVTSGGRLLEGGQGGTPAVPSMALWATGQGAHDRRAPSQSVSRDAKGLRQSLSSRPCVSTTKSPETCRQGKPGAMTSAAHPACSHAPPPRHSTRRYSRGLPVSGNTFPRPRATLRRGYCRSYPPVDKRLWGTCCVLRPHGTGIRKVKVLPRPSTRSTVPVPPWALRVSCTIYRPMPVPPGLVG